MALIFKIFRKCKGISRNILKKISIYKRDIVNKCRYGIHAPKYMEQIWIDPRKIDTVIGKQEVYDVTGIHRNRSSAIIVNWDDVDKPTPLMDEYRIRYCFEHWKTGKSWNELGVIDYMSKTNKYGSWPTEKIQARFEMLDKAFKETKTLGRIKSRKEVNPENFREQDGIYVHIAKNGKPVFGGNGYHRLAIAKVLELKQIPACVGIVDKNAIPYLKKYRKKQP